MKATKVVRRLLKALTTDPNPHGGVTVRARPYNSAGASGVGGWAATTAASMQSEQPSRRRRLKARSK